MKKLINKIEESINLVYKNDLDLIWRNNYEVTISCKLSQYLFLLFKDYHVDCEYNKHIDNPKEINWVWIRPDIVIHTRWTDENNLVCIEIKKETNPEDRNKDYQKLKDFTKNWWEYRYKLWVFIDFWIEKPNIIYFTNWKQNET
jgi:hypothetical protein